jgi:transposase
MAAEAQIAQLLPDIRFPVLLTVPGWGTIRAGNYGAAVGDPGRWPGACQLYRTSGLSPTQYESAGNVGTAASAGRAAWLCGAR